MVLHIIKNIFSKKTRHWNKEYNSLLGRLENKMLTLNDVEYDLTIHALSFSHIIINSFLGPDRNNQLLLEPPTNKEVRKLNRNDFNEIIKEMVRMFFTLLLLKEVTNRESCDSIFDLLFHENFRPTTNELHLNEGNIQNIIQKTGEKFTELTKIIASNDFSFTVAFSHLTQNYFMEMEESIIKNRNS